MRRKRSADILFVALAFVVLVGMSGCSDTAGSSPWSFGDKSSEGDGAGGCVQMSADGGGAVEAISCSDPGGGPVATREKCGTTVYGTEEQLSQTPREHPNLELMALEEAGSFVAPPCLYKRIARDVGFLKERLGNNGEGTRSWEVRHSSTSDGKTLRLPFDEETAGDIAANDYEAWDCLNSHYGEVKHEVDDDSVVVKLEGIFDLERVANGYADLPGIAEGFGRKPWPVRPTGSAQSQICLEIDGDSYHYVVVRSHGDCNLGCVHDSGRYFTTTPSGKVCKRGEYNSETDEGPAPEWTEICESSTVF